MYSSFHKKFKQQVFRCGNNKKCFLGSKSVYKNHFEGSFDTEDWSNDCGKFSVAIIGINYILKYDK